MEKMKVIDSIYQITRKKRFQAFQTFKGIDANKVFDFAYDMSFGEIGAHRKQREQNAHVRKPGEIFTSTFQGKLAEYGIYYYFNSSGISLPEPDLETYGLGKWDAFDFHTNGMIISVKSTKYYGDLLLLEANEWNDKGQYVPNLSTGMGATVYDYFILVRVFPSIETIMKNNRLYFSDVADKESLNQLVFKNGNFSYDIPGYIPHHTLLEMIRNGFFIPKDAFLNSKNTTMDVNNYYVQSGDLLPIGNLIHLLRN